jgi:hypothetical protein
MQPQFLYGRIFMSNDPIAQRRSQNAAWKAKRVESEARRKKDDAPAWNGRWDVLQRDKTPDKPVHAEPIFEPTSTGWDAYIAQNHDPKIVFDEKHTGGAAFDGNPKYELVPISQRDKRPDTWFGRKRAA